VTANRIVERQHTARREDEDGGRRERLPDRDDVESSVRVDRDGVLEAGETDRVPRYDVLATSGRDGESRLVSPLGEEIFE
jgi:hypothetical protein